MSDITIPRIDPGVTAELPALGRPAAAPRGFAETLRSLAAPVVQAQGQAARETLRLAQGEVEDLHTLQIALQKADLSFQLLLQVRNKVMEAYREIMQMQV